MVPLVWGVRYTARIEAASTASIPRHLFCDPGSCPLSAIFECDAAQRSGAVVKRVEVSGLMVTGWVVLKLGLPVSYGWVILIGGETEEICLVSDRDQSAVIQE